MAGTSPAMTSEITASMDKAVMADPPRTLIITNGAAGADAPALGLAQAMGAEPIVKHVALKQPYLVLAPYGPAPKSEIGSAPWPELIIGVTRQDRVRQLSSGLYAQNAAQWNDWFRTLAGLRFDQYRFDVDSNLGANSGKRNDHLVSPKLSLIFGPWAQTEFFVNSGYGFHSNDARGTVIRVDPKNPSTAVDPVRPLVRTRGEELGVRTEIIPGVQSSLAFWQLKQDSELLFVGDAGTTEPSYPSLRRGVEWINYARPTDWLLIDAELAVTRARFRDNPAGDRIPGAVERTATLGVTVDNEGSWYGALQVRHFGPRPLVEDNTIRSPGTARFVLRSSDSRP